MRIHELRVIDGAQVIALHRRSYNLANKMARTAWAMMTSGKAWRMPKVFRAA